MEQKQDNLTPGFLGFLCGSIFVVVIFACFTMHAPSHCADILIEDRAHRIEVIEDIKEQRDTLSEALEDFRIEK